MTPALLTALALFCYLGAAVCYGAVFFLLAPAAPQGSDSRRPPDASRFGRPLLLAGIIAQFVAIGFWCVTTRRSPFAGEFGTLAVMAWAIALAVGLLDLRVKMPAVGATALMVACMVLFSAIMQAHSPVAASREITGQAVNLHVLAILASYGLLAVAFGCAAIYLLQSRLLKRKQIHPALRRLPPLETLDRTAYHAVAYALPLLTLGLILGLVRVFGGGLSSPPSVWLRDPHNLSAFAPWLLYVGYLTARLAAGWRGVRLQYILIAGLLITLLLYLIPSSTHRFN